MSLLFPAKGPAFSSIPWQLMDALGAHKNIAWVYLWLHRHGHGSDEGAWASVATLARECHMDPKAVKTALRWLVGHGWVTRVSRSGRTSAYFVRVDSAPARPMPLAQ
jgi:hypothetical protein